MRANHIADVAWRKSSHSGAQGGNCVEVAELPTGEVALRNSRDPEGPALIYTRAEIAAFVAGAKDGEFDLPGSSNADTNHYFPPVHSGMEEPTEPTEPKPTFTVEQPRALEQTTSRYRAIGDELQSLTDTLLAGDVILDRNTTERLLRVLGATALLHRMHRVDRQGRCTICRTKPRLRWPSGSGHAVCSVYGALSLHVGRPFAAPDEHMSVTDHT
jgi:hypothetical protein